MPFEKIELQVPAILAAPIPTTRAQMKQYIQMLRSGGGAGEWVGFVIGCMQQIMVGDLPPLKGANGAPLFREPDASALDGKTTGQSALTGDI